MITSPSASSSPSEAEQQSRVQRLAPSSLPPTLAPIHSGDDDVEDDERDESAPAGEAREGEESEWGLSCDCCC